MPPSTQFAAYNKITAPSGMKSGRTLATKGCRLGRNHFGSGAVKVHMKALVMREYRTFEYCDVPTPVPGKAEVLVRVKACAVCGSDVHGSDGSAGRQPPVIMGHGPQAY